MYKEQKSCHRNPSCGLGNVLEFLCVLKPLRRGWEHFLLLLLLLPLTAGGTQQSMQVDDKRKGGVEALAQPPVS